MKIFGSCEGFEVKLVNESVRTLLILWSFLVVRVIHPCDYYLEFSWSPKFAYVMLCMDGVI